MKESDFIFALLPPILAMLIQFFALPSDRYLVAAADTRQQRANLAPEAKEMFLNMMRGVLAIAAFTPTFVSALVSAFALVYDLPHTAEYVLILLIFGITVVLVMTSSLSGIEPRDVAKNLLKAPFGIKRSLPFTGVFAINACIYTVNAILIALAIMRFTGHLPDFHFLHE